VNLDHPPENSLEEELLAETSAQDLEVPEIEDVPWQAATVLELASAVFDEGNES
jgi:hypothetical protein